MNYVCFNGEMKQADMPLVTVQNRSFKWGDGLFETMKVADGSIVLAAYHFDRLFIGLRLLNMDIPPHFTTETITAQLQSLCALNECSGSARVRLAVFRNNDNKAEYSIEATPLSIIDEWHEQGFSLGLYPFARKSCDAFANLKTANYLPYVMAGLYAKENSLDECLVLNSQDHICDTSKANIFYIKGKEISTPALHQGCVQGVMRRYLIEELPKRGYTVHQREVPEKRLLDAEEVFLTNAIQGIRWVSRYKEKQYQSFKTREIVSALFKSN